MTVVSEQRVHLTPPQAAKAVELHNRFTQLPPEGQARAKNTLRESMGPEYFGRIAKALSLAAAGEVTLIAQVGTPRSIESLALRYGWEPGSWQMEMVTALDGAYRSRPDGTITAAEILTGVAHPAGIHYLTTENLDNLYQTLTERADPTGAVPISSIHSAWARSLAKAATRDGEDQRSSVSTEEIEKYLEAHPELHSRITMQQLAILIHQVSQATGEPEPFQMEGIGPRQHAFNEPGYGGVLSEDTLVSDLVYEWLDVHDFNLKGKVPRTGSFIADLETPAAYRAFPRDWARSDFDLGHLASNADGANAWLMDATFITGKNAALQTHKLNRYTWAWLEGSMRDLVAALRARSVIYVGEVYLGPDGQALPRAEWPLYQGRSGQKYRTPSHFIREEVIFLPNGEVTGMAYMVPNNVDSPTNKVAAAKLVQASRISMQRADELLGLTTLVNALPAPIAAALKADTDLTVPLPADLSPAGQAAADYLFGSTSNPRSWYVGILPGETQPALAMFEDALAAGASYVKRLGRVPERLPIKTL